MENNKQILFLWFGNKEPPIYTNTVLDKFKYINPNWNIIFIKYTCDQIYNYKKINDEVLTKSIYQFKKKY